VVPVVYYIMDRMLAKLGLDKKKEIVIEEEISDYSKNLGN